MPRRLDVFLTYSCIGLARMEALELWEVLYYSAGKAGLWATEATVRRDHVRDWDGE